MSLLKRIGLFVAAVAIALGLGAAQPAGAQDEVSGDELVVAAVEFAPYVERDDDVPGGFMYETWEHVATRLGWDYEVLWVETLDDLDEVIRRGDVDVAVVPGSSSGRLEGRFDFSSPVVTAGPVIGVHGRTENPITLMGAIFSQDILKLLGYSAIGLLILGHAMWLVDKRNPESDFAESYVQGVWDGTWWALVTVTTVGYGDTTPRTNGGRVVAMFAMLGSLFLVGAFVSEVTTALQSSRTTSVISGVNDIGDRPVGVVALSTTAALAQERGFNVVEYPTQGDMFAAAESGDIDVLVSDVFTVDAIGGDFGVSSSGDVLFDEFISFMLPEDSELRDSINAELAELHQSGTIREIVERWSD